MKKPSVKIIVLAAVIGLFIYFGISLATKGEYTGVGEKAYAFELEDINGKTTKLSDFPNQVVIVNYFATWCGPCVDEAPELEAFEKEYGDQFKLLIVDLGETQDRVKKFVKENKTTSTYLFDFNRKVSKEYNVVGQPETFVIDKQGIIREHYIGPITKDDLYDLAAKYQ
ncbi:TlpA family protein disulfide reductase [Bacillus sp. DNRA2]|uniref:TlpA family protein disulfide reductase n=1 Tax=Bacillus sp. DNRA2 TaxID=2723053 RepID=UPI00145F1F94|nr:TlpA disulfide reductase family protein [Bacillus sp. DNRA2]NMD71796.1 TlpA family protein disulfide reductase [Bacillus sp. DNRA2]